MVGKQAIKEIRPRNVAELARASSLMRLMSDEELPLETYVKHKLAPEIWYNEMRDYHLTNEEVSLMEKYLKVKCGVAESQEVLMQIVMDPQISNFDMKEANKLRKTIAKKQFKEIENVKTLFYEKGYNVGSSKNLLDYIWNKQVQLQLGYSFSELHTTGYALIALQEMNLAYRFPIIYWNTACLSVDSSAINSQDFYNLIEDDIVEIDDNDNDNKKVQNKIDYSKIAMAIDKFKDDVNIKLPDINLSRLSFTPNREENSILYGLKGITRVTEPAINEIMMNRPFSSLNDFLDRTSSRILTKDKIINLIKCGAFNKIENKSTKEILEDYIWLKCEPKTKLTLQNANSLIDLNLLPHDFDEVADIYKLTKELRKNRDENKIWYFIDQIEMPEEKIDSWKHIFKLSKVPTSVVNDRPVVSSSTWDSFYKKSMDKLRVYIQQNQQELLNKLNNTLFKNEYDKYCSGDELTWELDSVNFYFKAHPLEKAIKQFPSTVVVNKASDIIEGAADGSFYIKGKIIPRMKLFTIAGTVIDRDSTKGLVTLQTVDSVITLKLYKDLYAIYAQTINSFDNEGNKIVEKESFFEKGVHLLVTGVQRGATFVPKVYKNTGRKAIERIILDENNNFVRFETKGEDK